MGLVEYARQELELAGLFDKDSDYNSMVGEAVLELVKKFSDQGHSGLSASLCINILKEVLSYKPLTPLTGEDDEWVQVSDNFYQNRRCPRVFKSGDEAYQIDYYIFKEESGSTFTSQASRKRIESFPYLPEESVVIPVKGDGTEQDLEEVVQEYERSKANAG